MNTPTDTTVHTTVLLHESIDGLGIESGDVYVDGTLGGGGHSLLALTNNPDITVIGLDEDEDALRRAKARIVASEVGNEAESAGRLFFIQENFRNIDRALASLPKTLASLNGVPIVNRIMLDLGLSSDQFEVSGRGFSFKKDEPLLMTFSKPTSKAESNELPRLTARDIVNTWDEKNIADIIYGYGEETYSRMIAKGIVEARAKKPIETTTDLVAIIEASTPSRYHHGRTHPATKTFQALRITVNDEINALREGLEKGYKALASGGTMAVISFHSIEDRIVKHFFKAQEDATILTKKPITPSHQEISENPRSRSSKLRIIKKN